VAIYHLSAKTIGRSAGRSATAAAAYRSGVEIADARTGQTHDYTRKAGVLHSEIMAPTDAPDWAHDRSALWNAVEAAEKRKDAQLCREMVVALPAELDADQQLGLVRGFVQEQFVARGMVADLAVHAPSREGDERNHHAHILLTMRSLGPDGFGGKNRDWNQKSVLEGWRSAWEKSANHALDLAGRSERIDARSLAAQGIDRAPSTHLGPVATDMERRGLTSDRGDGNRQVAEENRQRRNLPGDILRLKAERALAQNRSRNGSLRPEPAVDPLSRYRAAVEAETPGTMDWAAARGALDYASDLVERGLPPAHHVGAIIKAGHAAGIEWIKAEDAAEQRRAEEERLRQEAERAAREQARARAGEALERWDREKTERAASYRDRATVLRDKIERENRGIEVKRSGMVREHQAARPATPEPPRGLLAPFRQGAYERAVDAMQSWRAGLDAALDWGRERQEVILRRLSVVRDFLRTADSKVDRQMRAADPERAQVVDGERERQAAELDRKAAEKAMQEARERIEARQKQAQERPKSQRELDREKRMEQAERQIAEKRAQNRSRGPSRGGGMEL